MTYQLHLDTIGFHEKPNKEGLGAVRNVVVRTSHHLATLTKQELVNALKEGYSIIPGVCDVSNRKAYQGVLQSDWLQQDFFFVDFDNGVVSLSEAIAAYHALGIPVFVAHHTYSSTPSKEKFHLGFCTSQTILDREIRDKFQACLMNVFANDIDIQVRNRNRYFNGTNKGIAYVDYNAEVDVSSVIEQLWNDDCIRFLPKDSNLIPFATPRIRKEKKDHTKESFNEPISFLKRRSATLDFTTLSEDLPVTHNGLYKYNMQTHLGEYLSLVELQLQKKAFVDGSGRKALLFDVFNMVSFSFGSKEAYHTCLAINNRFLEPLNASDVYSCTVHAHDHKEKVCTFLHETHYIYRYDTLLHRLGVEDAVVETLPYIQNKRKKEIANQYRSLKEERNQYIYSLRLQGFGCRRIYNAVCERYDDPKLRLSLSGIKKLLQRMEQQGGLLLEQYNNKISNFSFSQAQEPIYLNEESQSPSTMESLKANKNFDCLSKSTPTTMNIEQQAIYQLAMKGENCSIIARGGCGKSYLLDQIIQAKQALGQSVAICAATGLLAQTYDGFTIHRLFGILPNEDYCFTPFIISTLLEYDTIVIDEIGMVDAETFSKVCQMIQYLKIQYHHSIQLILAGDVFQLESVKGTYFFHAKEYGQLNFRTMTLHQNMRQTNRWFDTLLTKLREGEKQVANILNRFASHEEDTSAPYVYAYKSQALKKNQEILATLPGELIDLDGILSAKIGARVMITMNSNLGKGRKNAYFNGTQGILKEIHENFVIIERENGHCIKLFKQWVPTNEIGVSIYQYPLLLSYALTIHKVQGMTLDSLNIHPNCFAPGQLYTAISRVKTLDGIHLLAPIKESDVIVSPIALDYKKQSQLHVVA